MPGSEEARADAGRPSDIMALITALADPDGLARQDARRSLVRRGEEAVPALAGALADPDRNRRWEAAKALGQIGAAAASSAPALVDALEDRDFGVRWLAAGALISLGRQGLPPLLRALIRRADSVLLREGAHHVLRSLMEHGLSSEVAPVLNAMSSVDAEIEVPMAASRVLQALEKA